MTEELKTLKDMELRDKYGGEWTAKPDTGEPIYIMTDLRVVDVDELRAEAIKLANKLEATQRKLMKRDGSSLDQKTINFFKPIFMNAGKLEYLFKFYNLTKEDLK